MTVLKPSPRLWGLLLLFGMLMFPVIGLTGIVLLNLFTLLVINFERIRVALRPRPQLSIPESNHKPFISIQVPCYNEPPELLRATLRSLANLNYEQYEVIVLDNNTADPKVYEPVRRFCAHLGERFRFFHYDNVKGFKAGALNIAHTLTDPRTEFILVIDADYVLDPDLIQGALPHFSRPEIGLVQFPQAYLNTNNENAGLQAEYEHFFGVYMNQANRCGCVLATGTVSFIRKTALEAAGLWSGKSITEDVELGLNIREAGYEGVYVPAPLGRGLMPTDLTDLSVQRERWVYGNMQTLLSFLPTARGYCWSAIRTIVLFLTAWFNFLIIPTAVLLVTIVLYPFEILVDAALPIAQLCLFSIFLELTLTAIFFMGIKNEGFARPEKRFAALLTHLALSFEGAVNWIKVPFRPGMPFKRTNKFLKAGMQKFGFSKTYLLAAVPLFASFTIFHDQMPEFSVALFIAALFVLSNIYLSRQLRATEQLSQQFYQSTETLEL